MTHDLVTAMLGELDAQVVRITVTELKENTFYASITVQQNGSEIEIDSRPSDAIALAVRADAPIFAAEEVIEESAIEFEGEGEEVNEESRDRHRVQAVPRARHPGRVRRGERRRRLALAVDLTLGEVENLLEDLLSPSAESGPRFARLRYCSIHSSRSGSTNDIPRDSL